MRRLILITAVLLLLTSCGYRDADLLLPEQSHDYSGYDYAAERYDDGYDDGYRDGKEAGEESGYETGYEDGKYEGYHEGYADGKSEICNYVFDSMDPDYLDKWWDENQEWIEENNIEW